MSKPPEKGYVDVSVDVCEDGRCKPKSITFYARDEEGIRIGKGKEYAIDEILDCRPASSLKVGGSGDRYTIQIGGNVTFLYREYPNKITENSRWFVEPKRRPNG